MAHKLEDALNEIATNMGIDDQNERDIQQNIVQYIATRCLMGDALSDDEEKTYYKLIVELEESMKHSKKASKKLGELLLMVAEKVYEENSDK